MASSESTRVWKKAPLPPLLASRCPSIRPHIERYQKNVLGEGTRYGRTRTFARLNY